MKNKLAKLKKGFRPYYKVVLNNPLGGFNTVKCYKQETVIKYQLSKRYVTSEYITFGKAVKKALQL